MPDITMCINSECPLSSKCWRFVAIPNPFRQSYTDFKPYTNEDGELACDHFMEVHEDL
jgi:hypothetical protein